MTSKAKYPDKFSFITNGTKYDMIKVMDQWLCYHHGTKDGGCEYSAEQIDNMIADGWQIISEEPELVFPFTYESSEQPYGCYEVTKDEKGDTWWRCLKSYWTSSTPSLYTNENIKRLIKAGTWIVKSVGEPKKNVWESVVGSLNASKAPTSDVSKLTIEVDSSQVKEATEAFKELAQRVENVNISLESMQQLMQEMGLSGGSVQCEASYGFTDNILDKIPTASIKASSVKGVYA